MSKSKWNPEHTVDGDTMTFFHIDTVEKREVMIKAYESLKKVK